MYVIEMLVLEETSSEMDVIQNITSIFTADLLKVMAFPIYVIQVTLIDQISFISISTRALSVLPQQMP